MSNYCTERILKRSSCFWICILFTLPLQLSAFVYIGDQGFSLIDGSQTSQEIRLVGVEEQLLFTDRRTDVNSSLRSSWMVMQANGSNRIYEVAVSDNIFLADNLGLNTEIGDGLNWWSLESASRAERALSVYTDGGGHFFDASGFLGVRTFADGEDFLPYYGWIRIEHSFDAGTFTVHDWAWNSTPGEPILAGEIPEPAAYAAIIGVGALLVVFLRRRFFLRRRYFSRGDELDQTDALPHI
jgi:hypothetical protein